MIEYASEYELEIHGNGRIIGHDGSEGWKPFRVDTARVCWYQREVPDEPAAIKATATTTKKSRKGKQHG